MRVSQTISISRVLVFVTGLLACVCFGIAESRAAGETRQPIAIQFSLDRPINAGAAPFVLAATDGLFGSEGLAVTIDVANG